MNGQIQHLAEANSLLQHAFHKATRIGDATRQGSPINMVAGDIQALLIAAAEAMHQVEQAPKLKTQPKVSSLPLPNQAFVAANDAPL